MTYCRICGESTSVYVCGRCVEAWRDLITIAAGVNPLIMDEVARLSVKAKPGGGGGEKTEAVALGALMARMALHESMYALYRQIGADSPAEAVRLLHQVQERPRDVERLWEDFTSLEEAVKKCYSFVDAKEEVISLGLCACGCSVRGRVSAQSARCAQCGVRTPVPVLVENRRNNALAQARRRPLKDAQMVAALAVCGYEVADRTIQSWVRRGKLKRDSDGCTMLDEVLALCKDNPRIKTLT
ncbi:hypothetical protein E4U03_04740 [Rothia nasimurium]|uniref:PhnA protein n=1 Tax=Rothia nasimurium TaxID=85336 RepID=A0A4Y9F4J3_9MICC|nr:hypothetical protein [Rothia nasimurium]MBF0807924.1 hypothetical protein [Rothia nasimurium]TFU22926.1 hypothetical protein E4U03_04740 [Rothia nasimurium]